MQQGRSKRFVWPLTLSPKEQVWLLRVPDHVFWILGEVLTSETLIVSCSEWSELWGVAAIKGEKSFGSALTPSV